jgi:16S rRNA (cytidine1402-2'-O)-methyltransferase
MMRKLILVPVPVGNLGDMTFRAVEVLRDADILVAEDTRTVRRLLQHFEIPDKRILSFHKDNEHRMLTTLLRLLEEDNTLALTSEAGTPGISDPGFLLVRACVENGIPVETLPGATAFVPALVSSGLPCDRFFFEGFLPPKKGRNKRLAEIAALPHTVVIYESPHRLLRTLRDLTATLGAERKAVVAKEITKIHENYFRGTLGELSEHFEDMPGKPKGEYVVIIEGKGKDT